MSSSTISLSVRLENALSTPYLNVRCDEITRILHELNSNKDTALILRRIIESIFGVNGHPGWGIGMITQSEQGIIFNQMRAFLGACGPLLSLTYKLAQDPFRTYLLIEFPISYLPAQTKADIEEGTAGFFYSSKIQNPGPGKVPSHILLNAFEFYMFHFAYFLVGPNSQRSPMSWLALNDALFPVLLEDYLREFLPCDATVPPGPASPPISTRGFMPLASNGSSSGGGAANLHLTNIVSPISRSGRLLMPDMSVIGGIQSSSPIHPHPQQQPINTWTSQVVAQIFLEMWVNHSLPSHRSTRTSQYSTQVQEDVFVPSNDHVRVVRMLIKHLHYFTNSIKARQPTSLDDLKKNLWPICRKSLYHFLKHMFNHWPLDSSFRLVLETWLSYIQPWRYLDYEAMQRAAHQQEIDATNRFIDPQWKTFIAENLLFYSLLTEQLLGRLLRLDLSAARNANILFRLLKVFNQANFSSYINDIENFLENNLPMQRSVISTPTHNVGSDGSPSPQALATLARKNVVEMEGTSHVYVPLFGSQAAHLVNQLQVAIQTAYNSLVNEMPVSTVQEKESNKAGFSWISSIFQSLFESSKSADDTAALEETKKTVLYLETSLKNLISVFNLTSIDHLQSSFNDTFNYNKSNNTHIPDQVATENGIVLTNFGRVQMMRGMKRLDLKYEGDPDLRLIDSYEITPLVRCLYSLSTKINNKYGEEFKDLFYRNDLVGRVCRVILSPPKICYEYIKSPCGSPTKKVSKKLPPRISLRFLANKKVLLHIFGVFVIFNILFGFSTLDFVMKLVIPFIFCYILAYVIIDATNPVNNTCYSRNEMDSSRG